MKKDLTKIASEIIGKDNITLKRYGKILVPETKKPSWLGSAICTIGLGLASLLPNSGCSTTEDFKKEDHYLEWNISKISGEDRATNMARYEMKKDVEGKMKKVAVIEHQDGDYTGGAIRQYVKSPFYTGYVTLFGTATSEKHDPSVINLGTAFDGKTKQGIVLGGTFEKTQDKTLKGLYTGFDSKKLDFIIQAGVAQLENNSMAQLMIGKSFEINDNAGYCIDAGVKRDEDGLGVVAGHFRAYNKGKQGADIWATTDCDGKLTAKAKFALKNNDMGKFMKMTTGFAEKGLTDMVLIEDYIDRLPLDMYAGDTVLVLKYTELPGDKRTNYLAFTNNFGKLSFIKDFYLGITTTQIDQARDRDLILTPSACMTLGPVSIYYEVGTQSGEKPNHYISVWTTASDIAKLFKADKKEK